ncbi:hypothetical protein Droror1_Dr00018378 [Drosera rotundifolia]
MGCAASSVSGGERVQACKERKKVMKQLLGFRGDYADSLLAYLRALKNTGVALRQFTESESMELEHVAFDSVYPPSPPPPLPPSPPPPPPLSPDEGKFNRTVNLASAQEEIMEIDDDDSDCTLPPPPIPPSSWDRWDSLDNMSLNREEHDGDVEVMEEDNWAESRTEFEEGNEEEGAPVEMSNVMPIVVHEAEMMDDNTLSANELTQERVERAMVFLRSKRTLPSIIKELDDYFLKASASSSEIAVLVDIDMRDFSIHHDSRETKRSNSAKVFSSLSWSRSSRSLLSTRNTEIGSLDEPCKPGAHSITLAKLYAEEQRLYKALKEEELTRLEFERKSFMLLKQEEENGELNKIEKTRVVVENLESDMSRLQESICRSSSHILALVEEELHPQLVALLSGLKYMWSTMFESHEAQARVSQQLNLLTVHHGALATTQFHRESTIQLESEVKHWYNSFCRLANTQREYVRALHKWIGLANSLLEGFQQNDSLSAVHTISEEWQHACNEPSEKAASEAINRYLSVIHSMVSEHEQEWNLKKKCDKLESKLQKELDSLREAEMKLRVELEAESISSSLSPKHPLSLRRAKAELLRKQYEDEKAKYLNSVRESRSMTLKSLKLCLPDVFETVTAYSDACSQALETILFLPHGQD